MDAKVKLNEFSVERCSVCKDCPAFDGGRLLSFQGICMGCNGFFGVA